MCINLDMRTLILQALQIKYLSLKHLIGSNISKYLKVFLSKSDKMHFTFIKQGSNIMTSLIFL